MLTNTERQQIVEEVNAGTYGIDEALDDIAAAQKGEEVRKALYAEALVLNREGHAGSTDMIARQQIANLQTSVNGQISTLRTEVGDDIDDLETALNSGLATQNGKIAAQNATIANVVANYNVEYGSTELWASTGETGALAAGTTVTLSEDVSHFDYIDIYSFCGNSNVLDTVPVDAKLQSSQGYALRWVNLSDPDSGSYKAYVRIIETRLHIIGTTLTIDHQVTYRNGEEVNISGAEITQSNRSTYMGELGIMKVVGRKIAANTEIEDVRIGADGTEYASAGQAVRAQVNDLKSAIPAIDTTLSVAGAAADAAAAGSQLARVKSALKNGNVSQVQNAGPNQTTYQGITYTKNPDGSVTMKGTATATSIYNIYQQEDSFPDGIVPGGTYSFSFSATNQNVTLRIYFYIGSDLRCVEWFTSDGVVHVPTNATGLVIRIGMTSGTTVDETVHPMFWTGLTNADLSDKIDTVEKSVKNKATIAWSHGTLNADGSTSNTNGAISGFIKYPNDIYIEPGMQISVSLYRGEGYLGKINASGLIDKVAGSWKVFKGHVNISDYLTLVDADSIRVTLKPTNDVTITSDNVNEVANANVTVYTDKYVNNVEQKKKEPIIETGIKNPLYPFYNQFVFKSISKDGSNIIYGANSNVRCSVIAEFENSVYLTMLNPDYSFGIYWYDGDGVYHSKLWDTTWEVPGGVPVGIAIRRHEASSNSERIETETPWIYLVPCSMAQEPKDYFKAEIEDTIQKVKVAYTEPGLCFLLSTDQHYMTVQNWLMKYDNITDMVGNMKAVCKGIAVDGHIALGDIADFKIPISTAKAEQFGIKDMSYANLDSIFYHWMDYAMAQLRSVHPNFIYVPGNHDDNRYLNRDGAKASVSEWDYTKGEVFSYYMAHNFPEKMFNTENNGLDYYLDYPQFKIRVIAIDSNYYDPTSKSWNYGYSDATVSWLTNVLSSTPSGYSVLLLSHMSPVYTHNLDNYLYPNMDSIQNDIQGFIDNGGDFIGTLYGHSHVDWSTTNPWLEISFCSQKLHNGSVTPEIGNMPSAVSPDRSIGTASEDCWNVVLILPGSRKIKVIRFGAGDDMEFAY